MMVPSVIPDERLSAHGLSVLKYPGLKEDVYLSRFRPDPDLRRRLNIKKEEVLVVVRPPATEAHYHNPESEKLLTAALELIVNTPGARGLILPRNKRQEAELRAACSEGLRSGALVIPENVEDGLNLVWNSDLVISGGGTMNREAAAMGVPVYSIFRGKIGAVDRYLADQNRMVLLETEDDCRTRIRLEHRQRPEFGKHSHLSLETIVQNIVHIMETQLHGAKLRQPSMRQQ
jgi:predicted glycosyltransferase